MQQERVARDYMIAEQNQAYEESLQADRKKVRDDSKHAGTELWEGGTGLVQERKKKELEEKEEMERQSKEVRVFVCFS